MGTRWASDLANHHGWAAQLLADGTIVDACASDGSQGGSRVAAPPIGWVAVCECGWQGPRWFRVTDVENEEVHDRHLYRSNMTLGPHESLLRADWEAHMRPRLAALSVNLAYLAWGAAPASQRMDAWLDLCLAVDTAIAAGTTWAAIGLATGVSERDARAQWEIPPDSLQRLPFK
ncbi:MAG: hypothetical protein WC005_05960 [Candidatus Nanopelagicales bacterium]